MMDKNQYTQCHVHPTYSATVEIVAHERKDAGWDVFIFEPRNSVPELDIHRIDDNHIFFKRITSSNEIERVATEIDEKLGEQYQRVPFFREKCSRKICGKIYSHLKKMGCHHMEIHSLSANTWEICIRQKDIPFAEQIAKSNV